MTKKKKKGVRVATQVRNAGGKTNRYLPFLAQVWKWIKELNK